MRAFPAMSTPTLGLSLRRLRRTRAVPALPALADEIESVSIPTDEATPRLIASWRALTAIQAKGPRGHAPSARRVWWNK